MKIKKAISNDIPKLADLMKQLGNPTSIEQVKLRCLLIKQPLFHIQ